MVTAIESTPHVVPHHEPAALPPAAPHHPDHKHRPAQAHESEAHVTSSHTPDAVQAKFRSVKQEYLTFKGQYGWVLEERWNSIASEITYGKADKFEKLDAMLDGLRHEMSKIRSGG